MFKVLIRGATFLIAIIGLHCCQMTGLKFHVYVDSLTGEKAVGSSTYILLPGNKNITANDIQFREYAAYVHRAMKSKGFIPTEKVEEADLAVFLSYGIGNPEEHKYSYSLPVWGQTGVSSSYTTGTITSYGGFGTYSGTTTYTPSYGITGYTTGTSSYATYFRFMLLDAWDLKKYRNSKKETQVWKTTVTSTGSSGDLRRVFPVLVGASKRYIGENTGTQVKVMLDESDQRVIETKGIAPETKKK